MAEKIIIQLELDDKLVEGQLKKTTASVSRESKKIGEEIETNIGRSLSVGIKKQSDETNTSIKNLLNTFQKVAKTTATIVTVATVLEKRFGLITKGAQALGLDFEKVSGRFSEFAEKLRAVISGDEAFKSLKVSAGLFLQELGIVDSKLLRIVGLFKDSAIAAVSLGTALSAVGAATVLLGPIIRNFRELLKLGGGIAGILLGSKGIFGLTAALSALSVGFVGLGESLKEVDNQFVKAAGSGLTLVGIFTGSLAAALGFAIVKVGELANEVGSKLVGFFEAASTAANKAQKDIDVLATVISNFNGITNNAIGTTDQWNSSIEALSDSLNISNVNLRKAAQEIIQVGSQYGLQRQELEKLLQVTAEYAKVNQKDVFNTSVAIVSALQGQSQAVQNLGIKLNEASVQQFAYKNGINQSIRSLSENEKVQLRYNKLLDQFKNIAGVAAVAAGSLADQQVRLEQNQERITAALGRGARIIEQNNLLNAAYNAIISNVSDSVFTFAGFLGALGARVLQVGGFLLGFTFKIFALIKAVKILNLALSSEVGIRSFAAELPFINKSLNQLISNFAKTNVRITSLNSLLSALRIIGVNSFNSISQAIFGANLQALTFGKALSGLGTRLAFIGRIGLGAFSKIAVVLAPFVIKLGAIVAVFKVLQEAFIAIERRTGVFTQAFNALKREFTEASGVFTPVVNVFREFGDILLTLANRVFGFFVDRLVAAITPIAAIVARNPFGVFSEQTVSAFQDITLKLSGFRAELAGVDFDLRKLGETARSVASIDAPIPVNLEELAALRQEFANFGKTDLQLLEEQLLQRLDLIQRAFEQELLSQQEFETLKNQIIAQASQERFQILNKDAIAASKQLSRTLQGGLVRVVQSAAASIGKALAQGSFSFKSFVGTVLGIIGDLLLQLSGAFIAIGLGVEAIKASIVGLSAGPALAAGLALAILGGALKAFSSSLGGEQTSGGGVGIPGGTAGDTGGGFTPGEFTLSEEEERQGPSTNVAVNIQGDVLDSEETGIRIVDVLNAAFDKEGVVVKRGVIA